MVFLNDIRSISQKRSIGRQVIDAVGVLLFGVILGIISKYLDCTPSNTLPFVLEYLDVSNFLGRFAIWILLAVCISVYSASPVSAGIHVFVFFAGMVTSYYLYSAFVAGFFPKSYAMIWVGFTILSPFLAFICWYATGEGKVSLTLSAGILAVLFNMTFLYGWIYFGVRSLLELLVFVCGLIVLKRKTARESILMIALAVLLAIVLYIIVPFHFV